MNASSTNQSQGPWRWSVVWGNVLGSYVDMDKHCIVETKDRGESYNIYGESCCHRIKCSAANFLTTLMWR